MFTMDRSVEKKEQLKLAFDIVRPVWRFACTRIPDTAFDAAEVQINPLTTLYLTVEGQWMQDEGGSVRPVEIETYDLSQVLTGIEGVLNKLKRTYDQVDTTRIEVRRNVIVKMANATLHMMA